MQAFAMPRRSNDHDVAQLLMGWLRLHRQELMIGTATNQQVCPLFWLRPEHEWRKLMRVSKAGFVQFVLHTRKKRRPGDLAEEQSGAKAEL
jgi:hypothetical protein